MGIIFLTSTGLSCNKVRKVFIEKIKPSTLKFDSGRFTSIMVVESKIYEQFNRRHCYFI